MDAVNTPPNEASAAEAFLPVRRAGKDIVSPTPPPGAQLSSSERKVWDYICGALREEGLAHRTSGLAITIVCKTFMHYVTTELELRAYALKHEGSIMLKSSKSDYSQPHPLYYAARDLKQELLKWLPESCLTLPSSVVARAKMGADGLQDDLFGDLVAQMQGAPASRSPA